MTVTSQWRGEHLIQASCIDIIHMCLNALNLRAVNAQLPDAIEMFVNTSLDRLSDCYFKQTKSNLVKWIFVATQNELKSNDSR